MALLFDFAVVLVIYWVVLLVVPGIINSDYQTKVDQIDHLNSLHDAQNDIDDAQIVGERRRQGDHRRRRTATTTATSRTRSRTSRRPRRT